MSRIVFQQTFRNGIAQYDAVDTLKDRIYGRIAGGIAWPGKTPDLPGAIVIAGQELTTREPSPIFILGVAQHRDLGDLFQRAVEFKKDLKIPDELYCDTTNLPAMQFLSDFNRRTADRRTGVIRYKSVFIENGNIEVQLNQLSEATKPGKMLIDAEEFRPILSSVLFSLPSIVGTRVDDNPLLTALAFAVYDLIRFPETFEREHLRQHRQTINYNPLRHGMEADHRTQPGVKTEYDVLNHK